MTLGERIRTYRQMQGLSQDELAEKLNVSRQAITKWENDNGVPDIDNLIALSKFMGITLDELVMGEREENVPVITREATDRRAKSKNRYLVSVIGFSFPAVCWIISFVLNICNGNELVAALNLINVIIIAIPISINLKRYLEM